MKDYTSGSLQGWPESITIFTDGASRGNPGAASLGLVVYDDQGNELYCLGQCLGEQTNNFAEYSAVKVALQVALDNKTKNLTLKSDSQLLVKQLSGEYKVKSAGLKPLFLQCKKIISQLASFKVEHVRREFNTRSDEIANMALDQASYL